MIIQGSYSTPKVICVILYEFDGFTFFAKINNYSLTLQVVFFVEKASTSLVSNYHQVYIE